MLLPEDWTSKISRKCHLKTSERLGIIMHTYFIIHSFLKKCVIVTVNIRMLYLKVLYEVVEWIISVVLVTCIPDACYAV